MLKIESYERIESYEIKHRKKTRKPRNKRCYFTNHNAFDIEVTSYSEGETKAGIIYLWTYVIDEETVFYGRTLEDFLFFIENYNSKIEKYGACQVIYVHNFAYEFQFLRYVLEWEDVFLLDRRKPLYARCMNFEFRCSYLLTNMNLENFLKNYNCNLSKLSYDYEKKRFPWSELTEDDITYCYTDSVGLYKAISTLLERDEKTVATVPLTSTGFVRQDIIKSETEKDKKLINDLSNIDVDLYVAMKSAFVGGNTHANRFHVGEILTDVNCYDITSSYPYAQACFKYPLTPFKEFKNLDKFEMKEENAYLLLCQLTNIFLTDIFDPMPTISKSKCLKIKDAEIDNGRVLKASYVLIWVTDIEFNITKNHYTFDVEFKKVYFSKYGNIPDSIKSCIFEYFYNKCCLKHTDPYLYMKSKNKLNSIYGMSAFDIGKERYEYENGEYKKDDRGIKDILEDILETTPPEPYQFGVWTTAIARKSLDDMVKLVGDSFIYCDTDSVYIQGTVNLDDLNKEIMRKSEPYKVTYKGESFHLGVWKHDKKCEKFVTLGAKKYCYVDATGVHTVTAGVSKKSGVDRIESYHVGHVFKNATKKAWYSDENVTLKIEGHTLEIPSSIYMENSDYTLGITDYYRALLIALGCGDIYILRN